MKDFVADQRLAYLATVCPDGSPNLSPKGLTFVLDDRRMVIGEVRSPASIYNLGFQPIAELNVVDRNLRKGYRFKGACIVHTSGKEFDLLTEFLRSKGFSAYSPYTHRAAPV
ncbi:pyridoxamine 5'-phosphate oxidase family protein [Parasphingorhabdus sp.]|uniref:pyridoxamine 5'-phosphate oxidase family protein n=1 Tax=Parasphingorhabdus sp. TaxID=2709688 RepID=UPI003BAE98C0